MKAVPTPVLDDLLDGGVIDAATYEVAREKLRTVSPEIEPFDGMGIGVAWLLANGLLCGKDLDALATASTENGDTRQQAIRRQALEEFLALGDVSSRCDEDAYDELTRQVSQAMSPLPAWAWPAGVAATIGLLGWYWLTTSPLR